MPRILRVYLHGRLAGELEQDETGQLAFTYDAAWLVGPDARPLSQLLPLQPTPFKHHACRPFFAGLLPEAEKREQVARALGITSRNDFALLDRIGGECAGAITFLPADVPGLSSPPPDDYRQLTDAELADILRILPTRPLLAGNEGIRLTLAGAQDKLPVRVANGRVALPLRGAPSSHIVKPAIPRFPDTVPNEAFCLQVAKRLGLPAVEADLRAAGGEPYLLVTRYDRLASGTGALQRLHQEDFCQALGVPPELKYQSEGGPSLA